MSEKVDIVVVRLPWAACEKVLEHGAAEKPCSRVLLPQCQKLSYGEKKVDQWTRWCQEDGG